MKKARITLITAIAASVLALCGAAWAELPNPVAHWAFDEGSGAIAYDSAGDNDGVVYGAQWVDGVLGGALHFDGSNDYVEAASSEELKLNLAGSVSAWIKPGDLYRRSIVSKRGGSQLGNWYENYWLTLGTYNQCSFIIADGSNWASATIPEEDLAVDTWQHVAGTWDPCEVKIYLDGRLIDVQPNNTVSDLVRSDAWPLRIGYHHVDGWFFDGLIDDVHIYDVALSAAEVEDVYGQEPNDGLVAHWKFDEGSGSTVCDSAGDNDGTIYGATWVEGILGGALEFDGASDYVEAASSEELKLNLAGSVSAWIKPGDLYRHSIVSKRGSLEAGGKYENYWLTLGTYNQCTFGIADGSNWVYATIPEEDLAVNTWQHVVGTWDPCEIKIYLDGQLIDAQSNNTVSDLISSDACPLRIGYHHVDGWYFDGLIDDVRIYQVALSAGEVLGLFEEVPVPEAEVYHVDKVGGSDLNDGLSRATAFATIQKGIDSSIDGGEVLVWPGVYSQAINFLGKAIMVRSAGDAATIEAPGQDAVTFHSGEGADSVLKNFVIRNSGLAISANYGSSPTITNLTIVDNDYGIAAYEDSNPDISNCILWDNRDGDLWGCQARYSFVEQEIEPGPVAHWKFDEGAGSIAYDSVGSNDGVVHGAQWTTGQIDGALNFDGVDDCVALPDNSPVWLPEYDFAYSLWVCFDAPANASGDTLLDLNHTSSSNPINDIGCVVRRLESGKVWLTMNTITQVDEYLSSNEVFGEGEWYQVIALRNGTTQAIYVNGNLDNSRTCSASQIDFTGGSYDDDGVSIGRTTTANTPSGAFFLDGKMDDVRIYDRALSSGEVELLYEGGLIGRDNVDTLRPLFADAGAGDYHLLSERGRYWPEHDVWVLDKVSSPCIDAGDPAIEPVREPMPNGGAINMGAYGGTEYASMSEWPILSDYDRNGRADFRDFAIFCDEWLMELPWAGSGSSTPVDTTPPAALRWIIEPDAVSHDTVVMIAYAEDASGVEYIFANVTLGYDSGWQEEPNWIDTGLLQGTLYCYTLQVRDMSPAQNWRQLSGEACARTLMSPDTTPPEPNPMTWDANDPNLWPAEVYIGPEWPTGYGYIMTCTVAADPSGPVQYWFQCHEEPSINSGWINVNTWTTPAFTMSGQNHGFWVKARDAYGNETALSEVRRPSDAGWPWPE